MATLYKNNGIYYLGVSYNGKQKAKSLGTKDKLVAKQLKPTVEKAIILELMGIKPKCPNLPFPQLAERFLKENKHSFIDQQNKYGFTPLNSAAKAAAIQTEDDEKHKSYLETMQLLIKEGADPDARNNRGVAARKHFPSFDWSRSSLTGPAQKGKGSKGQGCEDNGNSRKSFFMEATRPAGKGKGLQRSGIKCP